MQEFTFLPRFLLTDYVLEIELLALSESAEITIDFQA